MALKDYIWTIGAVIYVGFMFPIFYQYTFLHDATFGVFDILAAIGAFIVLSQMFWAAFPREPTPEQIEKSRETGKPVEDL